MKQLFWLVSVALGFVVAPSGWGAIFDLRGTDALAALDNESTGVLTVDGVTATFNAIVESSSGNMNQTGSGFGINAALPGDETALLDGDAGLESISVSFSVPVQLVAVTVSSFGGDDRGALMSTAGSDLIASTGTTVPSFGASFISSFSLGFVANPSNSTLGNGFSFDSFEVQAIPEPGVATLGGMGALALLRRWRVDV